MKRRATIPFGLMYLFGAALTAVAGSLEGSVKDAVTLDPIVGADVTVHVVVPDSIPLPTETDSAGAYSVTGIPPNNEVYAVVAVAPGYIYSYARLDDLGSSDLVYDIRLQPKPPAPPGGGGGDSSIVGGTVLGRLGTAGTLTPLSGAAVRLTSAAENLNILTDGDGSYDVLVPVGSYSMSVSAAGYRTLEAGGIGVDEEGLTLSAVLWGIATDVSDPFEDQLPKSYTLFEAYPNPFNPTTTIRYALPRDSRVTLTVFNMLGQPIAELVDDYLPAGYYDVRFNGSELTSGVYFSRLQANDFVATRRLVLMK
ncbi:MAG: carboxypeptidase regulatory-like domain-containing protein [Bacteroidota bacterium]